MQWRLGTGALEEIMPMAMTMGLPSSLRVTSYAYGYAYGVAPASELPAMPMAMPSKSNGLFNYYGN